MPIQLDKILADIAKEKSLHPNNDANKKDIDEAWLRVGKSNKLSVHESRSIFKVLQKKYDQEKLKGNSTWKLFNIMEKIHQIVEEKPILKEEEEAMPVDEVEEYEMLEVQEPEEEVGGEHTSYLSTNANSTGSGSDDECPPKSIKTSSMSSPDKHEEKSSSKAGISAPRISVMAADEKKLLNTMASSRTASNLQSPVTATAAALQKKGIILKKATQNVSPVASSGGNKGSTNTVQLRNLQQMQQQRIQLPDSLKRKLTEDVSPTPQTKKLQSAASLNVKTSPSTTVVHTTTAQLMQVKQHREDQSAAQTSPPGINIITIPGNPTRADLTNGGGGGAMSSTAATVASTSTNGFSPRIEDIDFKNDIIFDAGSELNGASGGQKLNTNTTSEIINFGNFDNLLPPTFFKNLCNSSRHEALGLYVANIMNRLSQHSSAKLELAILRAIIDVQSDDLE